MTQILMDGTFIVSIFIAGTVLLLIAGDLAYRLFEYGKTYFRRHLQQNMTRDCYRFCEPLQ